MLRQIKRSTEHNQYDSLLLPHIPAEIRLTISKLLISQFYCCGIGGAAL